MQTSIRPTGITANRNTHELTIAWSDSHESIYPFWLLRYSCPCAECRGGHDKMGAKPDPAVFTMPAEDSPRTQINNLEAVGAYALTIEWKDGHAFGIYNWHYLRELCPCPVCRADYK